LDGQKSTISYFYAVIVASIVCSMGLYFYSGWIGVFQGNTLTLLELSLSFDNAVVNAIILANMTLFWRKAFITWGMIIAVFGMRLLFPIIIVMTTTGLGAYEAFDLSLHHPVEYQMAIEKTHHILMSFGGIFLLMVFFTFLFDDKKEHHWIAPIEKMASKWAGTGEIKVAIVLILSLIIYKISPTQIKIGNEVIQNADGQILVGAIMGIALFVIMELVRGAIEGKEDDNEVDALKSNPNLVRGSFASFLYLEMIDASFSFDGVLGAFAITQNLIIMMVGLGIGAFAVRSLTLLMVDRKTVAEYKYLEHGAMWSIGLLAGSMLVQIFYHLPEWLITAFAILPISAAFIHSRAIRKALAS
jgi:hypothetical protein